MTYDPLNTKDWQQSDNMAFLLRDTGDRSVPTENAFYLQVYSARRGDQEGERRIAGQICAALNAPAAPIWATERPTAGLWWVAIHPDRRGIFPEYPPVLSVQASSGWFLMDVPSASHSITLDNLYFTGAKWLPRETPADPFKEAE